MLRAVARVPLGCAGHIANRVYLLPILWTTLHTASVITALQNMQTVPCPMAPTLSTAHLIRKLPYAFHQVLIAGLIASHQATNLGYD